MTPGTSAYRSLWREGEESALHIVDQSRLPYAVEFATLDSVAAVEEAIRTMRVRGAPLIGVAGAFGLALAMEEDPSDAHLAAASRRLHATRPTAVNLSWALTRMGEALRPLALAQRATAAWREAQAIADEDAAQNQAIGRHGLALIAREWSEERGPVNILTHCNAGSIATVAWGTASAPIYAAHESGIPVHVWVDETRPRNQGLLMAWELARRGVAHTLVADNAGGHLMQRGLVDLVFVGADRITRRGDVCNKIGTYLKALAARDNAVPFYAFATTSTIDWTIEEGLEEIAIEERDAEEVRTVRGLDAAGNPSSVRIAGDETDVANPAFDVTPHDLVTGIVTEKGIARASERELDAFRPAPSSARVA